MSEPMWNARMFLTPKSEYRMDWGATRMKVVEWINENPTGSLAADALSMGAIMDDMRKMCYRYGVRNVIKSIQEDQDE